MIELLLALAGIVVVLLCVIYSLTRPRDDVAVLDSSRRTPRSPEK